MAISFKGAHFPQEIILMGVRWYVAYPLSYRHVEELMQERGVPVDHATIQRWVVKYSPLLEAAFHRRKRSVWLSWRMDETYIKDHAWLTEQVAASREEMARGQGIPHAQAMALLRQHIADRSA